MDSLIQESENQVKEINEIETINHLQQNDINASMPRFDVANAIHNERNQDLSQEGQRNDMHLPLEIQQSEQHPDLHQEQHQQQFDPLHQIQMPPEEGFNNGQHNHDPNNQMQMPPEGFPPGVFPQDLNFPHMMYNPQFMPPGGMMGRPGPGGPPGPFPFGMPPFMPFQNPQLFGRMKPDPYMMYGGEDGMGFKGAHRGNQGGKFATPQNGVKYRHNESEQRRRDKINHHFDELKLILPSHKNTKSALLEAAIDYIKKYQIQIQQLEKLNFDIARENNDIIQILAQANDFNQQRNAGNMETQ